MIDYLNRGAAPIDGRIGFIGLSGNNGSTLSASTQEEFVDLSDQVGVFGRADRLIEECSRVPGLAQVLLSDTWIVDSLVDAQRLMSQGHDSLRFVTLQGELVSRNQELVVGQTPHESSLVSRKGEVRQLRNALGLCDRKIEDLFKRQIVLEESFSKAQNQLTAAISKVEEASTRLTACATRLAGAEEEQARISESQTEVLNQLEEIQSKSNQISDEILQRQHDVEEAEQASLEIESQISDIESGLNDMESELTSARREIETQQLKIAKAEERFGTLESEALRASSELQRASQTFKEMSQQLSQLIDTKDRSELAVLAASETIASRSLALESKSRGNTT